MTTILFVCTANRYRSPLAAAFFRKELALRHPAGQWSVLSAGTWADEGMPAASGAMAAAARVGLNLADHRARSIDASLASAADLILVMEQGQKEAIQSEFPGAAAKVRLVSEAATGIAFDIPDPATAEEGANVEAELADMIHTGFDRICALAGGTA